MDAFCGTGVTDFTMVDANLQECFRALARGRGSAETRQIGGIHIVALGVRFQMFNAAYLAFPVESEADFDRRIAMAAVHFGARGVEWSLWLCDGWLPEMVNRRAERVLSRRGLSLATQMPGMIAGTLRPPMRNLPLCELRGVNSKATLDDFRVIGAQCFHVPKDWFEEVFDASTMDRLPFRAWVGYAKGKAIATAATIVSSGALGIYNVATLPDFPAQGIWRGHLP